MEEIKVTKGTTQNFNVTLQNEEEAYIMADGEKLIFSVKANLNDEEPIIEKEITGDGETSIYNLVISGEDTEDIEIKESGAVLLWYNLMFQDENGFIEAIPTSPFIVKASVRGV